jgi:hypothetical protein
MHSKVVSAEPRYITLLVIIAQIKIHPENQCITYHYCTY